jgi:cytochrome c556
LTTARNAAEAKVAIEARQAHFEDIKKSFEPLGAMLKRQLELDAELVVTNATRLLAQANAIPVKFAVDTRQFKDTRTDARDAVWASAADFKTKADALASAAAAAATVARTGNKGETLKALADIGRTCGACHDSFKAAS